MMVATANTLMRMPDHLARCAGGKMSPMMACVIGIMAPAPSPWKARKRMSSVMSVAWPQSAEPTMKMTMPAMKKRLRPKASLSLPQIGIEAVDASR